MTTPENTSPTKNPKAGGDKSNSENSKFDGPRKRGMTFRTREFDGDFLGLNQEQPFLGVISLEITKLADEGMPTAYISARKEGKDYELVLGFNPDFMRNLSAVERRGVICHELYHLVFQHITNRTVSDKKMAALWNVATDLAINSLISQEKLPGICLFPGKRPTRKDPKTGKTVDAGDKDLCDFIEKAPGLQSSDYYFEKMKEIIQNRKDDGEGEGDPTGGLETMDDHSAWDDLPREVQEQLQERFRELIGKAVRHCDNSSRSWGDIPESIKEQIRKMLSREIDWKSVIKNFIGRCRSEVRIGTVRRLSKKAPYLIPGARRKTYANFACFIDQSGSMSDSDISMLFAELEGLAKEVAIDVFHFDTEIDEKSHTVWKKGRPFPTAHRTRCGGTDFQAVVNFANKAENRGKWAGVVILTDGYAPTPGAIVGSKVLWVITPGGTLESVRAGDLAIKMKAGESQFTRR